MKRELIRFRTLIQSHQVLQMLILCVFFMSLSYNEEANATQIVAGTFSTVTDPNDFSLPGTDSIYLLNSDGSINRTLVSGLSGLEFITNSPGGEFGNRNEFFVSTIGGLKNADGAVYVMDLNGGLKPFLTEIDAVSVVFDTENVLGGGMFVSDFNNKEEPGTNPGKIWHITPTSSPSPAPAGAPALSEPDRFNIDLYVDLGQLDGINRAFYMDITDGKNGFSPGLYVTSPFSPSPGRIIRVSGPDQADIFKDGLNNPTSFVFGQGDYGEGMLIAEPLDLKIERLLSDLTLTDFATLGTAPIGPEGLSFYPDGYLYVSDFTSGNLLRVLPNGIVDDNFHASIPLANVSGVLTGAKSHNTVIPEPATITLVGLGILILASKGNRRKNLH